ncbi:MAG: TonB family protein [Chitinophagaceae bacterium]
MTNNQILQSNLLDIIFENRNKEYGAYALRKGYNKRLLLALTAGFFVLLFFVIIGTINKKKNTNIMKAEIPGIVIREIDLPEKKIEKSKVEEIAAKAKAIKKILPKVAEVKFTSPPKIAEVVKEPMAAIDDLEGKLTSDKNIEGDKAEKNIMKPTVVESAGEIGPVSGPAQPETVFTIQEREPEFPGGQEGLIKFLRRYLGTPENLGKEEKKVVRIRFKVEADGSINSFEIVTSGGLKFDNEVVRVVKKMPKWIPALQNGINVPVNYVLPVTFIGVEE